MNIFGVKVPLWVLIVLGIIVLVLIGHWVWTTIGGAIVLLLQLAGLIVLVGGALWGIQKFKGRS